MFEEYLKSCRMNIVDNEKYYWFEVGYLKKAEIMDKLYRLKQIELVNILKEYAKDEDLLKARFLMALIRDLKSDNFLYKILNDRRLGKKAYYKLGSIAYFNYIDYVKDW